MSRPDPVRGSVLDKCPYCDGSEFEDGPRGGASLNLFCRGCGAGFNVIDYAEMPRYLLDVIRRPKPQ